MSNKWGSNPIILDTQATDSDYDSTHDAKNGGTQYSTLNYCISKIIIRGANADNVVLQSCGQSDVDSGNVIFKATIETGNLTKEYLGCCSKGIFPKTIPSGCEVYLYV